MKALLILVDGMRPDSLKDIPEAQNLMQSASYSMNARTVFPSVTLPCHMSLFHSVDPARHGTTTNTYMPQVRPIDGLCEVLKRSGKTSAFFYNWEELRDLARPDSLSYSSYFSGHAHTYARAIHRSTDDAINYIEEYSPDFAFLYLGWTDAAGHSYGWMSKEYMEAVHQSWKEIKRIMDSLNEEYTVFITADHGGHDRTHGTLLEEDMLIPLLISGKDFLPGEMSGEASIKDIAPTIAHMLGAVPAEEWEGKSLI